MARGRRSKSTAPLQWEDAPQVREIARRLIEDHHKHLEGMPLDYLFRSTAARGRGGVNRKYRIVTKGPLDIAISADPRWKSYSKIYLLEFPKTLWFRWTEDEQVANVDCCLSQLIAGKSDNLQVIDLSLTEIGRIIKRHGLFEEDLRLFAKSVVEFQHTLDLDDPAAPAGEPVDDSQLEYRSDTGEILEELHPALREAADAESSGDAAAQEPADDREAVPA